VASGHVVRKIFAYKKTLILQTSSGDSFRNVNFCFGGDV